MPNDTVVLLDLEYTAWEHSREQGWSRRGEYREIVEIGLLGLRGRDFSEFLALSLLVRPKRNPVLSDYFKSLTGIAQEDVDQGMDLESAGILVASCLGPTLLSAPAPRIWSFGEDGEILLENYVLDGKNSPVPRGCFRNIRPALTRVLGLPARGVDSSGLPPALGIEFNATGHRAVNDCRAVAAALRLAARKGVWAD